MASNLNKAFMRAYAKDRQAQDAASAQVATPPAASAVPAPVAPAPAGPVPHAVAPAMQTAPGMQAAPALRPAATNSAVPTPAMERLTRPSIQRTPIVPPRTSQPVAAQPVAAQAAPMSQPASMPSSPAMQPTVFASRFSSAPAQQPPVNTVPPAAVPARTAQFTQAHSTQALPTQARPAQAPPSQQPVQAKPTAAARPQTTSAAVEATDVWRRIDNAHNQPTRHPANPHPRESVAVDSGTTTRRMQAAAAAPAPVAPPRPQPVIQPAAPVPAPKPAPMPLLGDEAAADTKTADARRRTVADFLYAAGQYAPGRVLASADAHRPPVEPAPAIQSSMPAATGHSHAGYDAYDAALDEVMPSHSMSHPMPSMPATQDSVTHEPLPRRMGQILRVDVPRGPHGLPQDEAMTASAMSATKAATAQVAAAPAPAPAPAVPSSTATSSNKSSTAAASNPTMLDASTAKYVIEQRRLDRAHKLNEAEEKLRSNAHKIFNPVWEVDNLQWPAVVDKLMEQRADSMAHVAAHLKTACQDGLSVLGVTSAGPSEGRTTVACCLARLAAMHGINVALVDLDLDRPTLCLQTNMEIEQDWRDCLSADIKLEEVSVHSLEDQLTMLPLKPRGNRPGLLASDGRIAEMLRELSESFELVIVDCARANSSGNVITGLAHTQIFDASIVVVDRRDSNQSRVEDAVRLVQQTGIESIGIVDNFSL